ncbi:MAG TPA: Trp biosynthesis-associated membrane protein [Mycobacteriales bacterium]|nr:Trp biosynthesis-associated membrane protein [Mycobacteriales bacterium]
MTHVLTGRRGLVAAMVASAAAGVVTVWASGRLWGQAARLAEAGARVTVTVTGRSAEPALPALGFALLVLAAALVATRSWLRRLVGLLEVVLAGAVIGLAATAGQDVARSLRQDLTVHFGVAHPNLAAHTSGWAIVTIVAGLLALAAGALTVVAGARWPAMGARYDAPTATDPVRPGRSGGTSTAAAPRRGAPDPNDAAWEALDRGEDPTA